MFVEQEPEERPKSEVPACPRSSKHERASGKGVDNSLDPGMHAARESLESGGAQIGHAAVAPGWQT